MYKTQMRWIEQAEERRFVGQAMFEQAPTLVWPKARSEAGARWLPRLGAWLAARPGKALVNLADRQPLVARPADDVARRALARQRIEVFRDLRQRSVEIVFRQVEIAELVRQQFETDIGMDPRLQKAVLLLGL